jgi:hypothetical protein
MSYDVIPPPLQRRELKSEFQGKDTNEDLCIRKGFVSKLL